MKVFKESIVAAIICLIILALSALVSSLLIGQALPIGYSIFFFGLEIFSIVMLTMSAIIGINAFREMQENKAVS